MTPKTTITVKANPKEFRTLSEVLMLINQLQVMLSVLETDVTHIDLLAGDISKHEEGYRISTADGHVDQADTIIAALLQYHKHYAQKGPTSHE